MATFNVKILGVDAIMRKFEQAPKTMAEQSIIIVDDTVAEIARSATNKAANLPKINLNSKYKRTGNLSKSIKSIKYKQGEGASVSAGNELVKYAPYVEFGTGTGFQIDAYPSVKITDVDDYARQFKRGKGSNMPYRPYMFNSYSDAFGKMINKLKNIKL